MSHTESPATSDVISPIDLGAALWRRRWTMVAIVGTFVLLGGLYAFFIAPPVYKSQVQIKFREEIAQAIAGRVQVLAEPPTSQVLETEKVRILSENTLRKVVNDLNLAADPEFHDPANGPAIEAEILKELQARITVNVLTKSGLLELNVRTSDPQKSALIATAIYESYLVVQARRATIENVSGNVNLATQDGGREWATQTLNTLQNRVRDIRLDQGLSLDESKSILDGMEASFRETVSLYAYLLSTLEDYREGDDFVMGVTDLMSEVIAPASVSIDPESPRKGLALAVSFVLGLIAAILYVLIKWFYDRPLSGTEDIAGRFGVPFWGHVILGKSGQNSIRNLRNMLLLKSEHLNSAIVSLATTDKASAARPLADRLAKSYAVIEKRVLLIDAASGKASEHPSLQDILAGDSTLDAALPADAAISHLSVTRDGQDIAAVLATQACRDLLENLRARFDVVLFDAAPVLDNPDTAFVARLSDFCVVTARTGHTPSATVHDALTIIKDAKDTAFGLALTDTAPKG